MPSDSIAIVPNLGYHPSLQFSLKACRWRSWLGRNRFIRHALNGGKVQIGYCTVDGYDEQTRTIYEYYGCYWHECPTCYTELATEMHPHQTQYTYHTLHEQTLSRELSLKEQGYQVVSLWEHEFDTQFQKDQAFQSFIRD